MLRRQGPSGPFKPATIVRSLRIQFTDLTEAATLQTFNLGEPLPPGTFMPVGTSVQVPDGFGIPMATVILCSAGESGDFSMLGQYDIRNIGIDEGRGVLIAFASNPNGLFESPALDSQLTVSISSDQNVNGALEGDLTIRVALIQID